MSASLRAAVLLFALAAAGCSSDPATALPDVHPAKGVVKRGGKPVTGGFVQFQAENTTGADHLVSGEVGPDGTFVLTTFHALDRKGERKSGVPAGKYRVTYSAVQGDQTAGRPTPPIQLPQQVTVESGENNLTIELPAK
ncbi:MAG: hypothetical protein C0467_23600 [Planctomycetaceae bacterium]|nr:hypothetical protein [Planctomycetaceae bacterium]